MITPSAHTLFHLLRSALGSQSAEMIPSDIDWKEVIDLSFEQGVAAMLADGIDKATKTKIDEGLELLDSPELEDLKYEWFGSVFQAEEDYRQHLESISSLARTYAQAGISMMLLKGYGLGLNYPIPEHRSTGDIDVYLFNENEDENENRSLLPAWKRGDELIRSLDIVVEEGHEHHTTFQFRGQMVENHYDFFNTKVHRDAPSIEAKLKALSANGSREHLLPDGTKILLPSADFNVIFLIRHLGQHFAGERITLRQILDYGLFL